MNPGFQKSRVPFVGWCQDLICAMCSGKFKIIENSVCGCSPSHCFEPNSFVVANLIFEALPGHSLYSLQDSHKSPGIEGPESEGGVCKQKINGPVSKFFLCFRKVSKSSKSVSVITAPAIPQTEFDFFGKYVDEALPRIRKSKAPRILVHGGSVAGPSEVRRGRFQALSFENVPRISEIFTKCVCGSNPIRFFEPNSVLSQTRFRMFPGRIPCDFRGPYITCPGRIQFSKNGNQFKTVAVASATGTLFNVV